MWVIIGGSGMLFEASQALVKQYLGEVYLCGRQRSRYEPLLQDYSNSRFFAFDFSKEGDYQNLANSLADHDQLNLLVWVHSPYYSYLEKLLRSLDASLQSVYLVKGANSQPLPDGMLEKFPLSLIQLGKHPTEDRWLTHQEISQQVLDTMKNKQFNQRRLT